MDFYNFFSSSKDFTFDFSMSHCYTRYRSEEISPPDGSRKGSCRVGLTKHNTTSLNCVQPLPNLSDSKIKNTFNSTGCLTIAQTGPLAM